MTHYTSRSLLFARAGAILLLVVLACLPSTEAGPLDRLRNRNRNRYPVGAGYPVGGTYPVHATPAHGSGGSSSASSAASAGHGGASSAASAASSAANHGGHGGYHQPSGVYHAPIGGHYANHAPVHHQGPVYHQPMATYDPVHMTPKVATHRFGRKRNQPKYMPTVGHGYAPAYGHEYVMGPTRDSAGGASASSSAAAAASSSAAAAASSSASGLDGHSTDGHFHIPRGRFAPSDNFHFNTGSVGGGAAAAASSAATAGAASAAAAASTGSAGHSIGHPHLDSNVYEGVVEHDSVHHHEAPTTRVFAHATGGYDHLGNGAEKSSYVRDSEDLAHHEDGHVDDDHYYKADSYSRAKDEHEHEQYNDFDEDYIETPHMMRKKKSGTTYLKQSNKKSSDSGSAVLAQDRHSSGYNKDIRKTREHVDKRHEKDGLSMEHHLSDYGYDDEDEMAYNNHGLAHGPVHGPVMGAHGMGGPMGYPHHGQPGFIVADHFGGNMGDAAETTTAATETSPKVEATSSAAAAVEAPVDAPAADSTSTAAPVAVAN